MLVKMTILAAIALFATAAHAQRTQNFYDSRGNIAGTAITAGTATTLIDKRGRFVGTAINRDSGMALHDRHGSFTRSVARPLPQQVRPAPR